MYISAGASSNLVGTTGQDGALANALERNVIPATHQMALLSLIREARARATSWPVTNRHDRRRDAALGNLNGVMIGLAARTTGLE